MDNGKTEKKGDRKNLFQFSKLSQYDISSIFFNIFGLFTLSIVEQTTQRYNVENAYCLIASSDIWNETHQSCSNSWEKKTVLCYLGLLLVSKEAKANKTVN